MNISILKNIIKEEIQKTFYKINEINLSLINKGDVFTLHIDIGKFKSGEKVKVISKNILKNDIELIISNGRITDNFFIENNQTLDENEEQPISTAETPETPPGPISKKDATNLIKNTKGKFFTVAFIKKDGTRRLMNARLGVKMYLKGGRLTYNAESKGLIPIYDVKKKSYRMINTNTITDLKIGNNIYKVK
jgi:hypothetical protein